MTGYGSEAHGAVATVVGSAADRRIRFEIGMDCRMEVDESVVRPVLAAGAAFQMIIDIAAGPQAERFLE